MSDQNNITEVGEAWSQHYKGDNEAALVRFKQIVASNPTHIDANYGLALCFKKAGQKDAASGAFQTTKKLIQGHNVDDDDDNSVRLRMLLRLVDQHLAML